MAHQSRRSEMDCIFHFLQCGTSCFKLRSESPLGFYLWMDLEVTNMAKVMKKTNSQHRLLRSLTRLS